MRELGLNPAVWKAMVDVGLKLAPPSKDAIVVRMRRKTKRIKVVTMRFGGGVTDLRKVINESYKGDARIRDVSGPSVDTQNTKRNVINPSASVVFSSSPIPPPPPDIAICHATRHKQSNEERLRSCLESFGIGNCQIECNHIYSSW